MCVYGKCKKTFLSSFSPVLTPLPPVFLKFIFNLFDIRGRGGEQKHCVNVYCEQTDVAVLE